MLSGRCRCLSPDEYAGRCCETHGQLDGLGISPTEMGRLTTQAKSEIRRFIDSGRVCSGVTLVAVNSAFTDTLRGWMSKPGAPRKNELLILACDAQSEKIWINEGLPVVTHITDGTWGDLVSKRHEVLALLCQAGIDAFHSDADAFWLRDPREYCRSLPADVVFSQGTVLPAEACHAWGFVLCTGFFYARASERSADFFHKVASSIAPVGPIGEDQVALNLAVLEAHVVWRKPSIPSDRLLFRGLHWERSKPDVRISYYEQPVFGKSEALDLSLCLLPHRLFARLGPVGESTIVEHLLENKSPEWRQHVAALKARHSRG